MSAANPPRRLRPDELAVELERWALRREKILERLDIRAAREARALAKECRRLGGINHHLGEESWNAEWTRVRRSTVELLARGAAAEQAPQQTGESPAVDPISHIRRAPQVALESDAPAQVGKKTLLGVA